MTRRIIALLLLTACSLFSADPGAKPVPTLEFRPVVPKGTPNATPHVLKTRGENEDLFLSPTIILDASSVERAYATVEDDPTRASITIELTAKGASDFAAYTRKNVGERIAMIVNGTIVTAPIIRDAIFGGSVAISGDFTFERAQELARSIKPDSK
jgi:preprotein translocase subunit SecD